MDKSKQANPHDNTCTHALLCAVFRAFTVVLIAAGAVILVLWLTSEPKDLEVFVESASLSLFDLRPNNTLYYNLSLDVSLRNPSQRVAVHFGLLECAAFFSGARFGFHTMPKFHQRHKSMVVLHPTFQGLGMEIAGPSAAVEAVAEEFEREKREGLFSIHVKIYTRARLRRVFVKSAEYRPEVDCYLRLPVTAAAGGGSTMAGGFGRKPCRAESFL